MYLICLLSSPTSSRDIASTREYNPMKVRDDVPTVNPLLSRSDNFSQYPHTLISFFGILELQETKLPVRLISATNEQRLGQEHETTPLRVKEYIEDVSSELDNGS
ncbi:hypothetical protein TNCV_3535191 [Trichonephila clavipes]|nr:hypothetical protein TNCV_3535191 [Trichonephila clavipes]